MPTAVRGTISFKITDYQEFIRLHRLDDLYLLDIDRRLGLDRCGGNVQGHGLQLPVSVAGFIDLDGGNVDPGHGYAEVLTQAGYGGRRRDRPEYGRDDRRDDVRNAAKQCRSRTRIYRSPDTGAGAGRTPPSR